MIPEIGKTYKTPYGNAMCLNVSENNEDGDVDTLWYFISYAQRDQPWRRFEVVESEIEAPGPHTIEETELREWFERDRAHVHLVSKRDGSTLLSVWDDDVSGLVETGYLVVGKRLHQSAYDYWLQSA